MISNLKSGAPIVSSLDPQNQIAFKLFRESTKFVNNKYVKVWEDYESFMIGKSINLRVEFEKWKYFSSSDC